LLVQYAKQQSVAQLLTLVLIVVAGFECSTYVGGVTFAIAALAAAPILFAGIEPAGRIRFAIGLAVAAVLVVGLAAPFILDQAAAVAARGGGSPIVVHHFEVLGEMFPPTLRRVLDVPAYWFILLPIEFPAAYIAGAIALTVMLRSAVAGPEKTALAVFVALAAVGLLASWLLVSTLGDKNDLGLRAVLPATMILIVAAAVGMTRAPCRALIAAAAVGGLILTLPGTVEMIRYNIVGDAAPDDRIFADTPELWAAVRHYAAPTARVANNPLFLRDLTPWPANMSWALLSDRDSCFAGRELALVFAPLPTDRREAINAQFIRVFDGRGTTAMLPSWCLRTLPGTTTRSPQVPITVLRKAAMADGGFTYGFLQRTNALGAQRHQIPANQLKPRSLQYVSRNSFVTSIALIHFAFL
jgi:hypothetical protein